VDGDQLHYQAITDRGQTVDSGVIHRQKREQTAK
jgi:hypothetical protein